ncbi:MAG: polyprenyl synthetase family protein [Melioribacteraceae bacterium]|nr:polyprenyl synthetase family protein [Melioribacteraceae bacterium]
MREEKPHSSISEIEKPHPDRKTEWWFFQGYFQEHTETKFYFMLSFFRIKFPAYVENNSEGYSLLFSILNAETKESKYYSLIDQSALDGLLKAFKTEKELDFDQDLIDVLVKEIGYHGPPLPIKLKEVKFNSNEEFLKIDWKDFQLYHTENRFEIIFPHLKEDSPCKITILTEKKKYSLIEYQKSFDPQIGYSCYPNVNFMGQSGENNITGEVWMDHQWGGYGWVVDEDKEKKILGWDWFGINLDNGMNLIVLAHKYVKTNEVFYLAASLMIPGEQSRTYKNVKLTPLENWESPVTHIEYSISWKIEVNELNLNLIFTPIIEDQELQIFGIARAVWEGVGFVEGTYKGKSISGRARGEFFGNGYIFDFQNYLQRLADRVDKRIEEFLPKNFDEDRIEYFLGKPYWQNEPKAYTELISVPVWDLILRRGKRWRPIYGLLMHEALGKPSGNYERSCCLAELIHSGALIIDDIEDNSILRRGDKALHLKYGLDVALNAGNMLYFLPSAELFNHEHLTEMQKLHIHEIMMKTYLEAHFGQTLDIYWSKNMSKENIDLWLDDNIESKILQMYDYKTAAGPKGLAEIAALLNDSSDEIKKAAIDFSRAFAVAFQIIDDVHNFSNSSKWTKECGEDIKNGKLTFVIAKTLKFFEEKEQNRFKDILCDIKLRNDNDSLSEAIELVRKSGVLEESKDYAKQLSLEAWDRFSEIVPSCEAKIMLNLLCLKMLDLAYDT